MGYNTESLTISDNSGVCMTFFAAIFQKDKKKILYNQCRILFDQI
jgi:hypothetical protein